MDHRHELLTILMEECAEVIHEASKIIRFGEDSEYNGVKAIDAFEKELGDLQCMIKLLFANDMVSFNRLDNYADEKYQKLKKWSNLIKE